MSVFVIWMDASEAKLYEFSNEKMERRKFSSERHLREESFFLELASALESASRIVLVGPDDSKNQFRKLLTELEPRLAQRVIACEMLDFPTDSQIADLVRRFFKIGNSSPI